MSIDPNEPVLHISMLLPSEDEAEAKVVIEDLMAHLQSRLEYWGYGAEWHTPSTLMGEIL